MLVVAVVSMVVINSDHPAAAVRGSRGDIVYLIVVSPKKGGRQGVSALVSTVCLQCRCRVVGSIGLNDRVQVGVGGPTVLGMQRGAIRRQW